MAGFMDNQEDCQVRPYSRRKVNKALVKVLLPGYGSHMERYLVVVSKVYFLTYNPIHYKREKEPCRLLRPTRLNMK